MKTKPKKIKPGGYGDGTEEQIDPLGIYATEGHGAFGVKPVPEREIEKKTREDLSALKASDLVAFKEKMDVQFVDLIDALLIEGPLSYYEAIQEAMFELKLSRSTSKGYLMAHTARNAEFRITNGTVIRRK